MCKLGKTPCGVSYHGMNKKILDKNFIIDKLQKRFTIKEIAKELNCHDCTISNFLVKNNIDRHLIKFNYNFFETIDAEEKAYWLGYITADGCVFTGFQKSNLSITSKDFEHLEKWRQAIKCILPIKTIVISGKDYGRVDTSNKKLITDLSKYGIIQNKTYNLIYPYNLIPEDYVNHYIRGYFDGDGCIFKNMRNNIVTPRITFVGASLPYLEGLKQILKIDNKICPVLNTKHYNIYIGKCEEVIRIMDWLYKKATIFLDRKKEKYLEIRNSVLTQKTRKNQKIIAKIIENQI